MACKTLNYLYLLMNLSVKSLHSSESVSQSVSMSQMKSLGGEQGSLLVC